MYLLLKFMKFAKEGTKIDFVFNFQSHGFPTLLNSVSWEGRSRGSDDIPLVMKLDIGSRWLFLALGRFDVLHFLVVFFEYLEERFSFKA